MREPEPLEMIAALRAGPYRGWGALRHLAADLGVKLGTLKSWMYGVKSPSYESRGRLRRLWESHGSPAPPEKEADETPPPE